MENTVRGLLEILDKVYNKVPVNYYYELMAFNFGVSHPIQIAIQPKNRSVNKIWNSRRPLIASYGINTGKGWDLVLRKVVVYSGRVCYKEIKRERY